MRIDMANKNSTVLDRTSTIPRFQAFEKAREAALTLLILKEMLTPAELETLEILLDKKSLDQISKSLKEAKQKKFEPLENILK